MKNDTGTLTTFANFGLMKGTPVNFHICVCSRRNLAAAAASAAAASAAGGGAAAAAAASSSPLSPSTLATLAPTS